METQEFPLSYAQERLWFLDQLAPGSPFYNLQIDIPLPMKIDEDAWKQTLQEIVRRHEALRTTFSSASGRPMQFVLPTMTLHIPVFDLSQASQEERAASAARIAAEDAQQPFDLAHGPLLRGTLLRLQDDYYLFLLTMHHIISDGWSMDVLTREIEQIYTAFAQGRPSPLPELAIQYPDFAVWQREWLEGKEMEKQLGYWREQLDGISTLELPTDRSRPPVPTYRGGYQSLMIPPSVVSSLRAMCQREGTTLFMGLLAAFQTLLHRYTGQDDIVTGTPIANRNRPEIEPLIGFFVNTLVMRTGFGGDGTFRQILGRVREVALGAYAHQDVPFEKLVEELQPQRDTSRNPLFQVMFVFQNSIAPQSNAAASAPPSYQPAALMMTPGTVQYGTSKFDLTFFLGETDSGLSTIVEYSTDLFDDATISRMLGHWKTLLHSIVTDPNLPVRRLPILPPSERQLLLVEWNRTGTDFPRQACVHQLVEELARKHPEAVAVRGGSLTLTYWELNERANRLARMVRARGVAPEDLVGVSLARSVEMVVTLLAILKAGGAYLPLDPSYPRNRLAEMVADAQPRITVTTSEHAAPFRGTRADLVLLDLEETALEHLDASDLECVSKPENLAYVLYTSGSTGRPKGVCVTHRNVVRLVRDTDYCEFRSDDVFLMFAPLSFDASTFEVWGPLTNGARLEVFPAGLPSLEDLAGYIERNRVTTLWLTASLFHQMADGHLSALWPVRQLLAGGDVLLPQHCQRILDGLPGCTLINGYGPTETTTFALCHRMTPGSVLTGSVPIGKPIANAEAYILDQHGQLVPVGAPGELYIGGDGVSRGYFNDSALTTERFLDHPFAPPDSGRKIYRTGDRARWRSDGTVEFLGRADRQVKVRGFRVELGEIEHSLTSHPLVRETVVLLREDAPGDKRLVAYVTMRDSGGLATAAELRRFLQQQLPEHMVPSHVLVLDALPTSAHGKLDRRALPSPDEYGVQPEAPYVTPETELERTIAAVWQEILRVPKVGRQDNFFDLGGHSLLLVQAHSRLRQLLAQEFSMIDLFRYPTVESLARFLGQAEPAGQPETDSSFLAEVEERASRQRRARAQRSQRPTFDDPMAGGAVQ